MNKQLYEELNKISNEEFVDIMKQTPLQHYVD